MPRRFFRKLARKRHDVAGQWFMTPFRHLLQDPRLWALRRRWVVPAFALGLFIAYMPFPGHTLMGALGALALRINLPVAAMSTWVSNPATMAPMYYFAYEVGTALLNTEERAFGFEMSLSWVTSTFVHIWQPMLLGCVLLGAVAAFVGYVALDVIWRQSVARYKSAKRAKRRSN
jgi:uncharacterized protein (DUF2062 family)